MSFISCRDFGIFTLIYYALIIEHVLVRPFSIPSFFTFLHFFLHMLLLFIFPLSTIGHATSRQRWCQARIDHNLLLQTLGLNA